MTITLQFRLLTMWLACVCVLSLTPTIYAQELELSVAPLYLGTQVDPNVFFMIDDSGSMDWEITTLPYEYFQNYWGNSSDVARVVSGRYESASTAKPCSGIRDYLYMFNNTDNVFFNDCAFASLERNTQATVRDWRMRSAELNVTYYDPSQTYVPWVGMLDANFFAARSNPQTGTRGYNLIRNLSGFAYEVSHDDKGYTGSRIVGKTNVTDTPNGEVDLYDSHTLYTVGSSSIGVTTRITAAAAQIRALRSCANADVNDTNQYAGCFGTLSTESSISAAAVDPWGRTVAQAQQNVANWYQYHRRRSFVAKAAIASVITANAGFRYGLSVINFSNRLFVPVPPAAIITYSTHNADLLNDLNSFAWPRAGTPLRRGLEVVGRYYDNDSTPYADPIISPCQQNYSVLFSDGFWNGGGPRVGNIKDNDGDSYSDTLADIAKYFYDKDLSGLPNQVPTSTLDGNNKQHMVTFTVAFAVRGRLVDTDNDRYPNPELESNSSWGNPVASSTDAAKIDDMWHAAFNSKGYFLSAQSPDELSDAIADALTEIGNRVGSSASVVTNTGSLNAGSRIFQARFDSADWKGQLLALGINPDGSIAEEPDWDAGEVLNSQNYNTGRRIITWNPDALSGGEGTPTGEGIPFRFPSDFKAPNAFTEISSSQVEFLMTNAPFNLNSGNVGHIEANQNYGEAIVNYFRGDTVNEGGLGLQFRNRNSVLGDIVNSDPRFVGESRFRYPDNLEKKPYSAFKTANQNRPGTVYVGANDGMLHGFTEETGAEVLGYVPSPVYANLADLADPDYIHRYYVDAGPNIVDAYLPTIPDPVAGGSGAWRTVLTSGLGGGGQGIFALDVTNPALFNEGNAANIALWEFADSDDADLGFTFSRPQVAKMSNGQWVAIFGNGYNNTESDANVSSTGNAVLYIVDIETGQLVRKIDTGSGSVSTPNGLSTPLLIDQDNDFIVDFAYAGDLQGNLWKFDLTASTPRGWNVAFANGGSPQPLFTTTANQPITSQPQATLHPDNLGGFMVYFGTGKYFETSDNRSFSQTTQSFYGIWDKNASSLLPFSAADLLGQTINNQFRQSFDTNDDSLNDSDFTLRDVSNNQIDFNTHMGWKLDLIPQRIENALNTANFGERQISNALLRNGRIVFTTLSPSQQECDFGGSSFLMQLDFRDGSVLDEAAFDLNGDGEYNAADTTASGRASDIGIMSTVSILADGAQDLAFGSGASGDIEIIQLSLGTGAIGRQSWRQLE